MSLAVVLDDSPETLNNLKETLEVFDTLIKSSTSNTDLDAEQLEHLYDWLNSMYSILTNFDMFVEQEVDY